jgi:integrase
LRFRDINLEIGLITIEAAKNNRQRRVPMNETLTDLLKAFKQCAENRETFTDEDYLFASPRRGGRPYLQCSFGFWFGKILEKAGIVKLTLNRRERGICPHCLRHLFVHKSFLKSEAEGRNFDDTVPFLSEFLGHVSLYETEKYLQKDYTLYESTQNRVNDGIGGLFPKVVFS